jgi:hypothetical protein
MRLVKRLRDEWRSGAGTAIWLFLGWLIAMVALFLVVSSVPAPAWGRLVVAGLGCACFGFFGALIGKRLKQEFVVVMVVLSGLQIGIYAIQKSFEGNRNPWVGASGMVGGLLCVVFGVIAYCWLKKDFQFLRSLGPRRR